MVKSNRTHFSQLPSNEELEKILDIESKRPPPIEKKDTLLNFQRSN